MDNSHDFPLSEPVRALKRTRGAFSAEVEFPRAEKTVSVRHMFMTDHGAKSCVGIVATDGLTNTIYELGDRIMGRFFQMHDGDDIVALRTASRDITGMLRAYRIGSIGGPYAGPAGRIPITVDETPWIFTMGTEIIQIERGKEFDYFVEVALKGNNIADFSQYVEY